MDNLKKLKEISSELSVLYVEDEENIAQTLITYLSKFFNEVIYAKNGEDGLALYKEDSFDIVITDIKMPKMNGLDMSEKIKEINPNQNIIIVSAYSEIDNFQRSIKLGIDGYIIKPIDYMSLNKTLFKTVSKIKALKDNIEYEEKLQKLLVQLKIDNDQLKQFTDVIDKVAIVSRTDLKGVITYANDFFCDISGYKKEELIGQTHNIVRHPDMSKSVYQELWKDIQAGKTWEGTIKNKTKADEAYFVHAVIIPLLDIDNNIKEYIGIRFLTTNEEIEKRNFKKKVMTNYMEFKKTNINAIEMISSLNKELEQVKNEYSSYKNRVSKIESKYKKAVNQIEFYENGSKDKDTQYHKVLEMQKLNMQKISESHKKSLQLIDKQNHQINKLKEENALKTKEVIKINEKLNEQANIIIDLRDTIKNIDEDKVTE